MRIIINAVTITGIYIYDLNFLIYLLHFKFNYYQIIIIIIIHPKTLQVKIIILFYLILTIITKLQHFIFILER